MTTTAIFDSFNAQISATFPALEVGHQGVTFQPPESGNWLEVIANWNGSSEYGIQNPAVERGFFRVLVCGRHGKGLVPVQEVAEQIVSAFPKGSAFGAAVTDERPSISGPIVDKDRLTIPVTIRWRATRIN